ncbi:permease of the major facilitator superfamily [Microdochium bolleyi]|uniref:Permease of the major facilitator superfamily n=1 Tax=Microdochium bolleyi TaxID=196109 RepID=A0A136JDI6_9PEZI|nr:permease of the major facilitator superfamily [Microdochium bolleyi]
MAVSRPQDMEKSPPPSHIAEPYGDAESLRPRPGTAGGGPGPASRSHGNVNDNDNDADADSSDGTTDQDPAQTKALERQLRRKVDLRLCTIAGILCSLNLLDSGVISSAAVTSMPVDLGLTGNRFSVSIFIFTIASIAFQLPSTIACRTFGPRLWFAAITFAFGLITMCTAFVQTWQQMIALRVLLGMAMSGIYPGLTYLISTWYPRREQQTRFAFLQSGEVIILATGGIVNYGINHNLDGAGGIAGWRYMFLVQGLISMAIGLLTYFWIVDFPEHAHKSFCFLTPAEQALAVRRINADRRDVEPEPFAWSKIFVHALDLKVYGFATMFFLLNLVSTSLSYFLPIILQSGMGFSADEAILLSAPPYYYAVIPVLLSSVIGDRYNLRGPVIIFNCITLVVGFCMLGFASQLTARYIGTFLATGAYISNWAALSTYQTNNVAGQWKRVFTAAAVAAMNGAGGIAGSFIVRQGEAPGYITAVWVSIGSHIAIIALVGVFSVWFFVANRRQAKGTVMLEGVRGFRYTF